ncbi:hypothetical protein KSE_10330 [Kitasatospora setae KM-6054]|uniref:DNA2/NAM7 helicase-like C-terminal domain-containing protein n=1 Tax=Kitasatospora setae (strain ATCC 33774 / DSM 43861 / JCM 3304 / KCC A-0304 / NBRC 14216 / KM-6054) TaxID=452652 RepID=E4N6N7_KITSK|nr:hypothetical protein KSE_10330 [Kitasatospora setae KM-6054]
MVDVPHLHARNPEVVGKTAALLGFLREVVQSGTQRSRDTRSWGHLWLCDLPTTVAKPDGQPDRPLFVLDHVPQSAPPEIPAELLGWLDSRDVQNPDSDPPLAEPGPEGEPAPERGHRQDTGATVARRAADEVLRSYGSWLVRWRRWAERERSDRPLRELYETVYRWHQRLVQQDDQVELVLGTGLLTWSDPRGAVLHRHLLACRAVTEVDQRTARITVRLSNDSGVRLEDQDFLDSDDGLVPERSAVLAKELSADPVHPLGQEALAYLTRWQGLVLPRPLSFHPGWQPPDAPGAGLRLTFAPALMLRPMSRNALLRRYEQIAQTVVAERQAPLGLAQLVMTIGPQARAGWSADSARGLFDEEPLFPGKTNAQQRAVLDRLQRDTGVVVQGPPGTGKTHTIANLLSALLAQGQRVLVTSARDHALTVLRDKLPPAVRDLCVLLLSGVRQDGAGELERTVNALSDQVASGDPGQLNEEIRRLTQRRQEVTSRRKLLTEQVIALREAELYQHPEVAPGYSGTLAGIVRKVQEQAPALSWIGSLSDRAPSVPPLGALEAEELLVLLREGAAELVAGPMPPAPASLPTPGQVATAVAEESPASGLPDEAAALRDRLTALDTPTTDHLVGLLGSGRALLHRLGAPWEAERWGDSEWSRRALADRLARRRGDLWDRVAEAGAAVDAVVDGLAGAGVRTVALPEGLTPEQATRLTAAVSELRANPAGRRGVRALVTPKAQRQARELLDGCRVDGRPPTDAADFEALHAHLRAGPVLATVAVRWDQVGAPLEDGPLEVRVATLRERYRHLESVAAFGGLRERVDDLLVGRGIYLDLTTPRQWDHFTSAVFALAGRQRAEDATTRLAGWERVLRGGNDGHSPTLESLAMAQALADRDLDRYRKELDAYTAAHARQRQAWRCSELLDALRVASPALANRIVAECHAPEWDERMGRLADAWAWAGACRFVHEERAPGREQRLDAELTECESRLEELTGDLAAAKGRLHCLQRMTPEQRSALQAYRSHMASYGKGKGKIAAEFGAAARSAMRIAQGAVPAWVMPISRVAEMIEPHQNAFDVVIVDEASQAGMDALFLMWLAPRIIVVGDDKQCTPAVAGFGRVQQIQDRLTAHLPDVPRHLRQLYTPQSNLYQLLSTFFPSTIRLQEHFRCMPEIIGWSSAMFYNPPGLTPLRQYGGERLDPLLTHYVADGVAEGRDHRIRNPREAEAIVDRLVSFTADPAYEGRTMGVIVLQGGYGGQVKLLEQLIEQRIPAPVREKHRIRVGTPAMFQGDERHVILLSMVVDKVRKVAGGLRSEQQAYNVAASRAQDQMILFYSVPPDRMKPGDLRSSLLGYMRNPPAALAEADDLGTVLPDVPRKPFDSLFEQQVYLRIKERGYHVVPQYPAGNKRIDLVVIGARGRIGVECDGDHYHSTLEQLRHDQQRDRELQRVGWRFWRIPESEFRFDPDRALAGLWQELDRLGIAPATYHRRPDEAPSDGPRTPWTPMVLPEGDDPSAEHTDDPTDRPTGETRRTPPEGNR